MGVLRNLHMTRNPRSNKQPEGDVSFLRNKVDRFESILLARYSVLHLIVGALIRCDDC